MVFDPNTGPTLTYTNLATGAFSFELPRTTSYTYTTAGLVETINGPRKDVTDVTTYQYDANNDLKKIINPLVQVTEIIARDPRGYPTTVRDANGIDTQLEYNPRGRLTKRTVKHPSNVALDAVTEYEYTPTNLMEKVILPDGSFIKYEYDAAQRLDAIESSFIGSGSVGERIEFVLDDASNPLEDQYFNTAGTLVQKTIRQFDELSRLHKLKDNASPTSNDTEFDYDLFGNQTDITDALNQVTQQEYDKLNRVDKIIDAENNNAQFKYDDRDNLIEVTDQRGIKTNYKYDSADNLIEEVSADAGTTAYAYDLASNLSQVIDARGVVTNLEYDAANRLTEVRFPNATAENITYGYDSGTNAVGRLSSIADITGQISYSYDHRGNVTQDARTINSLSYNTDYSYDLADNIDTITYPSGRVLTYVRDSAGRITQIKDGSTTIVDSVTYHPFGIATNWTYGNGLTQSFTIDSDGRVDTRVVLNGTTAIEDWDFNYDAVHNIDNIVKDSVTEDYDYDPVYRLDEQTPIGQSKITYAYDGVGNRLSEAQNGNTKILTYDTTSNRLIDNDGDVITYDNAGNRVSDTNGTRTFEYNAQNRMTKVESSGTTLVEYAYNALGQRVQKDLQTHQIEYVYDLNGRLIGEYDNGVMIREYVYLDGVPVVQFAGSVKTYLHPDHLGTPRLGTNQSKSRVWTWAGEAFGSGLADEDPNSTGTDTAVNLRFPGQYFDGESGLHYNYFRNYDAGIGRYTARDPLGLVGGFNGYGYVNNSPLMGSDEYGLLYKYIAESALSALCDKNGNAANKFVNDSNQTYNDAAKNAVEDHRNTMTNCLLMEDTCAYQECVANAGRERVVKIEQATQKSNDELRNNPFRDNLLGKMGCDFNPPWPRPKPGK